MFDCDVDGRESERDVLWSVLAESSESSLAPLGLVVAIGFDDSTTTAVDLTVGLTEVKLVVELGGEALGGCVFGVAGGAGGGCVV